MDLQYLIESVGPRAVKFDWVLNIGSGNSLFESDACHGQIERY